MTDSVALMWRVSERGFTIKVGGMGVESGELDFYVELRVLGVE